MDQAQLWNPFIKLLVKHKMWNLILFLISFSYWGSDGERNQGLRCGETETVEEEAGGVPENCYSKDKRSHQSKLKRAPGLEWDSVQAGTRLHVSVHAWPQTCPHAAGQGQCWWKGGGGAVGLIWTLGQNKTCELSLISHLLVLYVSSTFTNMNLSPHMTQHLHTLITCLSMHCCLTATTINNSKLCSDYKMCNTDSPEAAHRAISYEK